jgi:hypothetical protein
MVWRTSIVVMPFWYNTPTQSRLNPGSLFSSIARVLLHTDSREQYHFEANKIMESPEDGRHAGNLGHPSVIAKREQDSDGHESS